MNQQNPGPGSPNTSPAKRKRGRPRKEVRAVPARLTPIRQVPDIVINPNQTAGTAGSADEEMLGRVVTGVINGRFGGGYLLNVRVGDSPTYLRGVIFQPGQYVPVTPENDVAPHLEMIQRIDFPVPALNSQAQMQSSIPSSGQGSGQPVEPELLVPNHALPAEIHSGASISLDNPSASDLAPMTNIPTSDSSIPAGGIPQTLSDPGQGSQSASTDKDSKSKAEDTNLLPLTENIDKELQTGPHTGSSVQLNEQRQDLPNISNVEFNQMPAPAGPEPIQSEQVQDEPMNSNIEVSELPVSAVPEPMQSEQISQSAEPEAVQSKQFHEPRNSNLELNEMPASADHENVQSVDKLEDKPNPPKPAHGGDVGPSESRFSSEGSDLPEMSDPQNHDIQPSGQTTKEDDIQPSDKTTKEDDIQPSGETNKEDDIQPSGETTKSVEPENPIGPDIL